MDPLNAVSLAASILQFVEFTAKLVNDGRQIYDSTQGATLENCDLEAVTQSLVLITRQISHNTHDDPSVGHHGPIVDPDAPTEQNLNDLGASCQDVAKELLDAPEHLKAPVSRNRWTSIVDALKTVWARGKIQGLRNRLDQYRFGINTALLVSLRLVSCHLCSFRVIANSRRQQGSHVDNHDRPGEVAMRGRNGKAEGRRAWSNPGSQSGGYSRK